MQDLLKQLEALNAAILVANRVLPTQRDWDSNDWRTIEEKANALTSVAERLRPTETMVATIKMAAPMHEHPARAVGRLGRFLRERGIVYA